MHRAALSGPMVAISMLAAALSGCSSGSGLSTASILGNAPTPPAAGATPVAGKPGAAPAVAPVPSSDPTSRAFQVGSVSARAVKCGYNFDVAKLKANYMAYEMSLGAAPDAVARIEKVYDVAYNGVSKAAAGEADYCSERKTQVIKTDLARLLGGDYEPKREIAQKKNEDGFFSGWFDGASSSADDNFGSGDWWEKQASKAGK